MDLDLASGTLGGMSCKDCACRWTAIREKAIEEAARGCRRAAEAAPTRPIVFLDILPVLWLDMLSYRRQVCKSSPSQTVYVILCWQRSRNNNDDVPPTINGNGPEIGAPNLKPSLSNSSARISNYNYRLQSLCLQTYPTGSSRPR